MCISGRPNVCSEPSYIARTYICWVCISSLYCALAKLQGLFNMTFVLCHGDKRSQHFGSRTMIAVVRSYIVLVRPPQKMQFTWCGHRAPSLSIIANVNVCWPLRWKWSTIYERSNIFSSIWLWKHKEQERNMIDRKSFLLFSQGRESFMLRFCSSFLYSPLSFLTYFHYCFIVAWQENLELCGGRWNAMMRTAQCLFFGCKGSARLFVLELLSKVRGRD